MSQTLREINEGEKLKRKPKYIYMCGVDYQHELEKDQPDRIDVYTDIKHLKRAKSCWTQCGIVKVKLGAVEWVKEQNFLTWAFGCPNDPRSMDCGGAYSGDCTQET